MIRPPCAPTAHSAHRFDAHAHSAHLSKNAGVRRTPAHAFGAHDCPSAHLAEAKLHPGHTAWSRLHSPANPLIAVDYNSSRPSYPCHPGFPRARYASLEPSSLVPCSGSVSLFHIGTKRIASQHSPLDANPKAAIVLSDLQRAVTSSLVHSNIVSLSRPTEVDP
jgi:hypothetical protein